MRFAETPLRVDHRTAVSPPTRFAEPSPRDAANGATAARPAVFRCFSARPEGFEPSTFGSGGSVSGFAGVSRGSQVIENARKRTGSRLQNSQLVAPVYRDFGAFLVHERGEGDGSPRGGEPAPGLGTAQLRVVAPPRGEMLTVRQVAAALRVSTATVYELVAMGELSHVRVGNSIRIPRTELPAREAPAGRS
jgi:excisionase family DNA binding protein